MIKLLAYGFALALLLMGGVLAIGLWILRPLLLRHLRQLDGREER